MNRSGREQRARRTGESGILPQSKTVASKSINRLQDAVYREMYRLEARQPGSEMGLALALLRVIVASQQSTDREGVGDWLQEICPIALKMIEDGLQRYGECLRGAG